MSLVRRQWEQMAQRGSVHTGIASVGRCLMSRRRITYYAELQSGDAFLMLASSYYGGIADTTSDKERLECSCCIPKATYVIFDRLATYKTLSFRYCVLI